jgi:hypothetical protein
MIGRGKLDTTSNEELARLLHRKDSRLVPAKQQRPNPAPAQTSEARGHSLGIQQWALGPSKDTEASVTERERRALFAALSKGTKANVGRDPTVAELVLLVEELQQARVIAAAAQEAIAGVLSIHIETGKIVFRSPTSERLRTTAPAPGGPRHIRAV